MPRKFERCLKKVKAKNRKVSRSKRVNPYAVCAKSTGQKGHKGRKMRRKK